MSLECAHQLFTPQDFVRALESSATAANRERRARYAPLDVNLQDLALEVAFPGRRVAQSYSTLFDFPVKALLEAAGARFDSVLCCQPHGEDYGADGLTRLTLNGRGYLIGWCAGDDSNHDVVTASWTPADDERLFERAVRGEFFSGTTRDYPLVGQCKSVLSFECSAIILDRLWRRRRPAAWGRWLRRWLGWYHAEVGDDLLEIDSEKVESMGVWTPEDLQAFVKDLHADPSQILAGIADGSLPTTLKGNLVLLCRLDEAGALSPPYRPPAVDPSSLAPVLPFESRAVDAGPAPSPVLPGPARVIDYTEGRELAWQDRAKTGRDPRYTPVTPREGWRRYGVTRCGGFLRPARRYLGDAIVVTATLEQIWDRAGAPSAIQARYAYTGPGFAEWCAEATQSGLPWAILSPTHGLVAAEAVITADDLTVSAVCRDDGFITRLRQAALQLDLMNRRVRLLGHPRFRALLRKAEVGGWCPGLGTP